MKEGEWLVCEVGGLGGRWRGVGEGGSSDFLQSLTLHHCPSVSDETFAGGVPPQVACAGVCVHASMCVCCINTLVFYPLFFFESASFKLRLLSLSLLCLSLPLPPHHLFVEREMGPVMTV